MIMDRWVTYKTKILENVRKISIRSLTLFNCSSLQDQLVFV